MIEQLVVSFASTAAMGAQMSSTAVTERTAFRVADYTFLAAGILLVLYWGMLLLGKVEAPIANSPTRAGAVALAGALRTAAHWLKGDRQPLDPLRILIWMFVALGGLTLMIFD